MLDGHRQLLNRQDGWQLVTSALGVQLLLTAACEGRGCLGDPTGGRGQLACGHLLCGRVQHREVTVAGLVQRVH